LLFGGGARNLDYFFESHSASLPGKKRSSSFELFFPGPMISKGAFDNSLRVKISFAYIFWVISFV